jgi:hypothetical protein
VTLGRSPRQADLLTTTVNLCEGRVAPGSIYGVLHRECFSLFPDEMFADLFEDVGRRSVPPMIVAVVMVLQRVEGLSDREAADRFCFDVRWKYAAGGLDFDYPGFVHTVLVDMRARLARSNRPNRIFETTLAVAKAAGLVGRRRVLDSTPLYDAVATMDTVTLIRSAVRGLLKVADTELEGVLRSRLARDDDYICAGKPVCDYDDPAAREALVDALAGDAMALLGVLEGRTLAAEVVRAAELVATVVGQDLDQDATDAVFRIARRVAKDRVISTVDTDARHGHKTSHHGFDGYKGHIAVDPDSELVTATTATAGNGGDADVAEQLLADVLPAQPPTPAGHAGNVNKVGTETGRTEIYADCAYGTGPLLTRLADLDAHLGIKVQSPTAPGGRFAKDRFHLDLEAGRATCPAGVTVAFRVTAHQRHAAVAAFGAACASCPLAARCTTAAGGRTITISPHETQLAAGRARRHDPAWQATYRATRPKVERKIGHLMRRRHGGRRARMRGRDKVAADLALLAAATNLTRLGVLGLTRHTHGAWHTTPA